MQRRWGSARNTHARGSREERGVSEGGRKQKERIEPSSIGVFAVCQLRIGLRRPWATRIRVRSRCVL